jgi:hypothetical protein
MYSKAIQYFNCLEIKTLTFVAWQLYILERGSKKY